MNSLLLSESNPKIEKESLPSILFIPLSRQKWCPLQKTKSRYKIVYRLEKMDPDIMVLAEGMGLSELKLKTKIPFSIYN